MTTESPIRRYAKGDAKRRAILDAALIVISECGYRNSSLQEIADAVGLTKAGVLHYFESREHLLAEVLRERDEADRAELTPADGDVVELLHRAIRHNKDVPGLVQLYSRLAVESESIEHAGHDYIGERYVSIADSLAIGILARQKVGTFRSDLDPRVFAHLLIAASDGLQLQWLHDPALDMAAAFEALVTLMETAPVRD